MKIKTVQVLAVPELKQTNKMVMALKFAIL